MTGQSAMHDPLSIAEDWLGQGRAVAIATVVETWGSAPRPVGAHLVIDGEGNFEGSVSGGCVEGAVIAEAMDVIETGKPRMLEFGVADETAWRVGLSCGGRIRVYVERLVHVAFNRDRLSGTDMRAMKKAMSAENLKALNAARRSRKAVMLVTDLHGGHERVVVEGDPLAENPGAGGSGGENPDGAALGEAIAAAFRSGKSGVAEVDGQSLFLNVHLPPPRIVVIGAVHISQALAAMAGIAGFDLAIIDPRTAFATEERFEGVDLVADWPVDVLRERPLDAYTALVAVTHDPKIDDFPIAEALRTGCFYIGALGSRKTHAKRIERLKAQGVPEADLARVSAPIGLDIGAASPAEIAVAILADIIQSFRRRNLLTPEGARR